MPKIRLLSGLRAVGCAILFAIAVLACLFAFTGHDLNTRSAEKSRLLDRKFEVVAERVEAFREQHGRLPTGAEWAPVLQQNKNEALQIELASAGFDWCDSNAETFRRLTTESYVLWVWRGEWAECAAPAEGLSTLTLDAADYTITGAEWSDTILWLSICGLCLVGAYRVSRPLFG